MADIKKINGMYVKDETARNSIEELRQLINSSGGTGGSGFSGSYNDLTDKPVIPVVDVDKAYVDGQISELRTDLEDYATNMNLVTYMSNLQKNIDELEGKHDADITELRSLIESSEPSVPSDLTARVSELENTVASMQEIFTEIVGTPILVPNISSAAMAAYVDNHIGIKATDDLASRVSQLEAIIATMQETLDDLLGTPMLVANIDEE